jgi:hypothetical protein
MKNYELKRQLVLNEEYEVIVVGGGPAGCAAATAAARENRKTLLVEAAYALGGMGTLGLVPWFCGYNDGKNVIARGIAEKVKAACYENTPHLKKVSLDEVASPSIDPEVLKRVYDVMTTEAGVDVLFGSQLCTVEMLDDERIDALLIGNKRGLGAYRAKIYIDATGDGDLAAWAGAEFEKGDAGGRMQLATHCFTITNIDEYGLENGAGIHYFNPESPIHRAVRSSEYPLINDYHSCLRQIGPKTFGFNTGHISDVDGTDPVILSKAMITGREMVRQYHDAFSKMHPAFANSFLCATGSLMGIRETRRIIGDYLLTSDDYLARRDFPDEICRNAYGIDVHSKIPLLSDDMSVEELIEVSKAYIRQRTQPLPPGESMGVPYRCLTPKGLQNVLVAGRCISTDRQANGSIRIMACCLNTGEAAGIAAAMSADNENVHEIDVDRLRQTIVKHGGYLPKI